jgi:Xaa-Pro aminopeptidase
MNEHAMGRIPTFSVAERDQRWTRVRKAIAGAGLDAVVGMPNSSHWDQFQADVRYLTQIGGNTTEAAVVFPAEGEVTAVVRGDNEVAWWGLQQDWVADIRPSRRYFSVPLVNRLRELGLEQGRVGIIGLEGLVRAPEGVAVWGVVERLRAELPNARFVDATQVLQEVRAVKSQDEIAFIRKAAALAESAAERMMSLARPGESERRLYGAMIESMVSGGGEVPTMILWGAGQQPPWPQRVVTDRVLRAGDIINNEIEAKWAGYIAQVVAPCSLGPIDSISRRVFDTSLELFEDLCGIMKPGVPFVDIQQRYRERVEGAGFETGAALLHGRGLGEDRPLLWGHQRPEDEALRLEEGMVFILKPAVFPPGSRDAVLLDGETVELAVRAGDTVVVTGNGAQRLGQRPLELVEL